MRLVHDPDGLLAEAAAASALVPSVPKGIVLRDASQRFDNSGRVVAELSWAAPGHRAERR
jgi:hypothetical protein